MDGIPIRPGKPIIIGKLAKNYFLPARQSNIKHRLLEIVYSYVNQKMLSGNRKELLTEKPCYLKILKSQNHKENTHMRAFTFQKGTTIYVKPFSKQDSSLIPILIQSNCLLIIPPCSSPKKKEGL